MSLYEKMELIPWESVLETELRYGTILLFNRQEKELKTLKK